MGDLGSGNHFLDALVSLQDGCLYFLIHTGSRKESNLVDDLIDQPQAFDETFAEVCDWAGRNRMEIFHILQRYFGPLELILDRNHNHFERKGEGVIIRKGAVRCRSGELTVVPSHLNGEVVLVRATDRVGEVFESLCHGTGRTMSRSVAKELATDFDFQELRERVYIPEMISDASLRTEVSGSYRDLGECLVLIGDLVREVDRYRVIAYLGQV